MAMSHGENTSPCTYGAAAPATSDTLLASLYRSARAAEVGSGLIWITKVRCWFAVDADLARSVLRSDAFAMRQHHVLFQPAPFPLLTGFAGRTLSSVKPA